MKKKTPQNATLRNIRAEIAELREGLILVAESYLMQREILKALMYRKRVRK